jgi:uncharacterized protein
MKTIALLVAVMLCLLCCVSAAPPSDASIEQMLKAAHTEEMLDQMMTQMTSGMEQGMQQALKGQTPTAAQKAKMDDFRKKLSALMHEELSFAKMKDVYMQVYRETFTQDEVNNILAFYNSPAGKAFVEKMPAAMQKSATLAQARMGPLLQKIQALAEQYSKELSPSP